MLLYCERTIDPFKKQPRKWGWVFASCTSHRRLVSRIYKEFKRPSTKKTNNSITKCAREVSRALRRNKMVEKKCT